MEDAEVLSQTSFPGDQLVVRVHAPKCAAHARAGSFAHVTCDPALPMRRPLSIMRVSKTDGWVEFLYKTVGQGLSALARRQPGETMSVMGPIGQPFELKPERPKPVLIGGGVGIPPMVFVAEESLQHPDINPVVFMGSEVPFPFSPKPSTLVLDGVPPEVIAAMPLMESWGIPSRLASLSDLAGCFSGYVTDLAALWIDALDSDVREQVEILACGPGPMLKAAVNVAKRFQLPCQVSLEEYMACAVGGCAGCTVLIENADGKAMKRVCVDGPVFDGHQVHPEAFF